MSQRKLYLYSPDGKSEGWYMEKEAPAGWLKSAPEAPEFDHAENDPQVDRPMDGPEEETLEDLQKQLDELEAEE